MTANSDTGGILLGHLALPAEWLAKDVPWVLQQQWLTIDEQPRFQDLRQAADRWRMLGGRFALRHCLRAFYGLTSARLTYGKHNKPMLVPDGITSPIDVNLTHDRRHILTAFSSSRDVGIDVADLTDFADWEEFAEDYLAAEEIAWARAAPSSEQPLRASRLWTLKEAILKSTGHGLDIDPREIILAPDALCPIVRLPECLSPAGAFAVHEWQLDAQARAALVCVQRPVSSNSTTMLSLPSAIRLVTIPAQRLLSEPLTKEELCIATA